MAADKSNQHAKEINALLHRLHSGCRFINFQDCDNNSSNSNSNSNSSSSRKGNDISNLLRNASPPDETHADLGRALANSYVNSIRPFLSTSKSSSKYESGKQNAVEIGERIVLSLCWGEIVATTTTTTSNDNKDGMNHSERANYSSVAHAFFGHLKFIFVKQEKKEEEEDITSLTKTFIQSQWQKWCIQCEELVLPSTDGITPSDCNGGGLHVLHACLTSYGYICHLGFVNSKENDNNGAMIMEDGNRDRGGCECSVASVYESLTHHTSRKYFIRTCVSQAIDLAVQPNNNKTGWERRTIGLVDSLSALFHSCILSARKMTKQQQQEQQTSRHQHAERRLLLQEILRGCSMLLHRVMISYNTTDDEDASSQKLGLINQISSMIQYLTKSLASYLTQGIRATLFSKVAYNGDYDEDTNETSNIFELGYDWLRDICDTLTKLQSTMEYDYDSDIAMTEISISVESIVTTILPQFTSSPTAASFEMTSIYTSLVHCIASLPPSYLTPMANNATVVALRLGSLALSSSSDNSVDMICNLMTVILNCDDDGSDHYSPTMFLTGGILTAFGCVLRCRPTGFDGASHLTTRGESMMRRNVRRRQEEKQCESDGTHLMDIVRYSLGGETFRPLMDIISASISDTEAPCRPLSLSDQSSGLLLSLSLLHISISSSQSMMEPDDAFSFLRSFLQSYPRMASRAVPSIIHIAKSSLAAASSLQLPTTATTQTTLLASLEFLASPCIVSDPHGAHLAWTFLSSLAHEGVPTAVRSSVIRLLPAMCSSNKRLFRRASDVVGKSMVAQDPIIRISATAALSEMADLDLLRDVEQIVGWIQNRLTDEEPTVVYYALETLRFLVVNEELEFDLVIRVLEKRLGVDLSDLDVVLNLDTLALESLVSLMGEGGLEEEDDEDESNDGEDAGGPEVSPQSIKAVSLLVELALSTHSTIKENAHQDEDAAFCSRARLLRRIYGSLSGYSSQIFGLDEESIRAWDGSSVDGSKDGDFEVQRFLHLKQIVLTGLDFAAQLHARESSDGKADEVKEISTEILESVAKLGKTLLKFEEEVHGSFLFRGGVSAGRGSSEKQSKGKSEGRTRVSKSVLSSLPSPSSIREMFDSDPRSSSATAMFYSIGSSESDSNAVLPTEDILGQMSECFSDIENEPLVEPAFQAIQVCSLMHCMGTAWKSIEAAEESVREELLDQVIAQTEEWSRTYGEEYAYVAMSAFALSIDDSAQCWPGVTNIHKTILEGQENYLFESEDTKLLCLSMIAARLSRTADARVTGLIDSIEQSLLEHSGQTCFGASFGLGIIVTYLMTGNINGTDPSDTWRRQQVQRIICILLTAFDTCLEEENDVVLRLISSIKSGKATKGLSQSCSNLDSLFVQDGSAQKMKSIMIGLSHSFPVINAISSIFLKCVLSIIDKLPWGSGKSLALCAAYKTGIDSGVLEQKDVTEAISNTLSFVQESSKGFGDALFSLASFCRLSSQKCLQEFALVAKTCHDVLIDRNTPIGGDDKLTSILAGCAAIGNLPGIASFTPNIYAAVNKTTVADIVKTLEEMGSNDSEELKYRDAATIGLGILCAMSSSSHTRNKTQKNTANKFDSIQAKDGSVMQKILQEIETAYSLLCTAPSGNGTNRAVIANKLCTLFSTLELIAMPGNFSRVIELTLNDSPADELELKASAAKLLVSQLDPARRRIGFDGRGFVDLSTRLAKMLPDALHTLVGAKATPIVARLLQNLIYQIPTSIGADVAKSLWAICRADLNISLSSKSMTEFLIGLKSILISVNQEEKAPSKRKISPALLRTLQKIIVTEIVSDLRSDAMPSNQVTTETVWTTYLQCVELVPGNTVAEAGALNCDINHATVFGMAVCASLSAKSARKVESWIALQEFQDKSMPNLRVVLLSTLAIATQARIENEMKESVLSIFEVMLLKGIDTMAIYLMAAKIAFFWESRQVNQLQYIDMSSRRVSKLSSFFVTRNLCFGAQTLPPELLVQIFHSFIDDLPSKLAVLCKMWKISDDVSNRASRIWHSHVQKEGNSTHQKHFLACIKEVVQLIEGGEI